MKQSNKWRNQITGTENKRLNRSSYCCCNNKSDLETCSPTRSWVASISCLQSRASPAPRRCLFPCCHSEPWWPAQGRASPLVPRRPGIGTLALRLVTRRPPLAVLLRPLPRRIWGMERAPCLRRAARIWGTDEEREAACGGCGRAWERRRVREWKG